MLKVNDWTVNIIEILMFLIRRNGSVFWGLVYLCVTFKCSTCSPNGTTLECYIEFKRKLANSEVFEEE